MQRKLCWGSLSGVPIRDGCGMLPPWMAEAMYKIDLYNHVNDGIENEEDPVFGPLFRAIRQGRAQMIIEFVVVDVAGRKDIVWSNDTEPYPNFSTHAILFPNNLIQDAERHAEWQSPYVQVSHRYLLQFKRFDKPFPFVFIHCEETGIPMYFTCHTIALTLGKAMLMCPYSRTSHWICIPISEFTKRNGSFFVVQKLRDGPLPSLITLAKRALEKKTKKPWREIKKYL